MTSFDAATWGQTDVSTEGERTQAPPEGTYSVSVQKASAFTSNAGNDVMLVELRVLSGPYEGHTWGEVRGFRNEGQITAAKAMCQRLGVETNVASLDELDSALKACEGEFYEIQVKQNKEYRNVFVNKRLSGNGAVAQSDIPDDGSFQPAAAGSTPTEDIPFRAEPVREWTNLKAHDFLS